LIVPVIVEYLDRAFLAVLGIMVVSLGVALILSGVTVTRFGFIQRRPTEQPPAAWPRASGGATGPPTSVPDFQYSARGNGAKTRGETNQ